MLLTFIFSVFIVLRVVLLFRFINAAHKPPLFGIYQQRNKFYFIKFVILYAYLNVRRWLWLIKRAYAVDSGKSGDGTIHVHDQDALLENKFELGQHPYAIDSAYFNGVAKDGSAIQVAVARRHNNACDALVSIKINGEEYLSPKLPETYLEQDASDFGEFKVQGIKTESFIPMRAWKLAYNGEMKLKSNPEAKVVVKTELIWSALYPPFLYDYQASTRGLARDLAREPWSRDYLSLVKKFHRTHYEQLGSLKGTVTIDGKEHVLAMLCLRDRTFGKYHDWRNFHRCVYHTIYLDNDDCIEFAVLSQPFVVTHLTTGFVVRKSDRAVVAIKSSDFNLYQHGENGVPPTDYGFTLKAGGQTYTIRVTADDETIKYIGKQRELKSVERWVTVEANGVAGKGLARWQYNNVQASKKELKKFLQDYQRAQENLRLETSAI